MMPKPVSQTARKHLYKRGATQHCVAKVEEEE